MGRSHKVHKGPLETCKGGRDMLGFLQTCQGCLRYTKMSWEDRLQLSVVIPAKVHKDLKLGSNMGEGKRGNIRDLLEVEFTI